MPTFVDTGSTDGAQDIIREYFAGFPGQLCERPWRDFGCNRTEALEFARGESEYVLIMDADNIFCAPEGWRWPVLTADAYQLTLRSAGTEYAQNLLVLNRLPWRWVGVLHEYITCDTPHSIETLAGPWIDRRHEGARSRDPDTYRKDAAILEQALAAEPDNGRYAFYLAQSLRDARDYEKAREAYRRRAAMPGWDQETWYSLYEVGLLSERLGASAAEVRSAFLDAYQFRPSRAEPLYQLARFHRERNEMALAYLFGRQAAAIPHPVDVLFIDESVYRWAALDELGIPPPTGWAPSQRAGRPSRRSWPKGIARPRTGLASPRTWASILPPSTPDHAPALDAIFRSDPSTSQSYEHSHVRTAESGRGAGT